MNSNSSKSGLFLMELIMSILFFTLATTVCIQMFVKSHTLSEESVTLNHAVIICQSLADSFYGYDSDMNQIAGSYENAKYNESEHEICLYYDENFVSEETSSTTGFKVTGSLTEKEPNLYVFDISFIKNIDNNVIYSLSPVLYKQHSGK